jgi:hypothetical protein
MSRRRRPPFRSRPHQRRRVSAMCLSASLSRRHKPACPAARPISGGRSAATSDGRHGVRAPSRCAAAWHASIARPRRRGTRTDARPTVQVGALTSVKTYFSGATSSTRRQLQGRFQSLLVAFRPLSSLTHLSLGKVHVHERERRPSGLLLARWPLEVRRSHPTSAPPTAPGSRIRLPAGPPADSPSGG